MVKSLSKTEISNINGGINGAELSAGIALSVIGFYLLGYGTKEFIIYLGMKNSGKSLSKLGEMGRLTSFGTKHSLLLSISFGLIGALILGTGIAIGRIAASDSN